MRSNESVKSVAMLATAAIAGLCLVSQAGAATYTWTGVTNNGADSSHWNQKKNWDLGGAYPVSTADTALFTGNLPTTLTFIPATTIGTVDVGNGGYNLSGLITNNLTLHDTGSLSGGIYTVNADYSDAAWATATGNTFNPKLHAGGTTINAGGTSSLLVTLPDLSTLSGGGTGTLNFGTILVGDTVTFTFQQTLASGLTIHEALQTTGLGGGEISILRGATPVSVLDGELLALSSSGTETYTLTGASLGTVTGTLVLMSNFDNAELAPITINLTGTVADPVPEPSSFMLLGLGAMYAVTRWRNRA